MNKQTTNAGKGHAPMKRSEREIKKCAAEFRKGMIGNKPSNWTCGMVCFALQGYLSFAFKINAVLWESDLGEMNHIWLMLPDGNVLDPTADQFNYFFPHKKYPRVYLGKPLDIHDNAKLYKGATT